MTTTRTLHTETYRDVTVEVTETDHPATAWSRAYTRRTLVLDGQRSTCPVGTVEQVAAKARKVVDLGIENDALVPRLLPLVGVGGDQPGTPALQVGDVASVYAMGRFRQGLVVKVTKTKATVAYTTASSSGRVFRKAADFAKLRTA